jgi:ABC-type uncharacterized transport system permease subunit
MNDLFTSTILIVTVASGIRLATPFLLASLGEALGQRSGVLNLGVDGVMLLGAFGAYYTVLKTGNLFRGKWNRHLSVWSGHERSIVSKTGGHAPADSAVSHP